MLMLSCLTSVPLFLSILTDLMVIQLFLIISLAGCRFMGEMLKPELLFFKWFSMSGLVVVLGFVCLK